MRKNDIGPLLLGASLVVAPYFIGRLMWKDYSKNRQRRNEANNDNVWPPR